ncbi:MAG: arylsulfatase [Lentimonas sp.]
MKTVILLSLLLPVVALAKPNIVVILADDLGSGDVSCYYEASKIETPNLDALAADGMRFTDAHSNSSVCTPTRYGVMTGSYCWRGRLKRGVLNGYSSALIEEGRATVASVLQEGGYKTACIGKWHLGMNFTKAKGKSKGKWDFDAPIQRGPNAVGFDFYLGIAASLDMPPYALIQNDRFLQKPTEAFEAIKNQLDYTRGGAIAPEFKHVDYLPLLAEQAEDFIADRVGESAPFFLYLPLPSPHKPVVPNEAFVGKSGIGQYGDYVVETDWVVGRVIQALKDGGVYENTLVIFTSDNASFAVPETYEVIQQGHRVNANFRGQKTDIFEGGHRVPYICTWPARIPAGKVSEQVVCTTDIMATSLAAAGLPVPNGAAEDSMNLLPVLEGTHEEGDLREATVHHSVSGMFAIRKGRWKLILGSGSGGRSKVPKGSPPIQLYDMEKDSAETTNLQEENPEVVRELQALLERYKQSGRSVEH